MFARKGGLKFAFEVSNPGRLFKCVFNKQYRLKKYMKLEEIVRGSTVTVHKWFLFGLETWTVCENAEKTEYKIFGIPFLTIEKAPNKLKCKIFSFLPIYAYKKKTWDRYASLDTHYKNVLKMLRKRAQQGKKIRVAFYIIEVFQYASVYEAMLKSDFFEPFIVVVPDVHRKAIMKKTLKESYEMLSKHYSNVYMGFDLGSNKYLDFSDKADIVFFGNPYSGMAHPYHYLWHLLNRNILTCFQNYGYFTVLFGRTHIASMPFFNACWRVFTDSDENYQDLVEYQLRKGVNAHVTGYFKMDKLADIKREESDRPRVLLCPHHTINYKHLQLSNFLKYADFFLELPAKYPEVDFIFRPHQLLHYNLTQYWSEQKADEYYEKMMSHPNVRHDTGQMYMETFVNSDAIIHDCGSFTAEYLFVNKPSCYMLKNKQEIKDTFLPMGQKCMDQYYLAYTEQDICNFIENVVLKGDDPLKEQRTQFSEKLKYNYPHAGEKAADYIREQIMSSK